MGTLNGGLNMLTRDVHAHIKKKAPTCDHIFIATNTKKTDKHDAVTQLVCQRCLMLVNFSDISSGVEMYRKAAE